MAASFLLSECLEVVFLNLFDENNRINKSTKDLYSCTLVSRYWCRTSTPFLYAYPFHHFSIHICNNSIYSSYFKLIRTLLSCIPKSEIEQIISSNVQTSRSPSPSTTFNYIKFIRGLIFNEISESLLFDHRKIWLPPYISNNTTQLRLIINHLVRFLCKHCNNLTKLEISNNGFFYNNTIELSNYKDHNGRSKMCNLEELFYITSNEIKLSQKKDLYSSLSSDICNLDLLYNEGINSVGNSDSLSQFICSQNKLKHIILSESASNSTYYYIDCDYNIVLDSLSTQSESLQTLEFKYLSFIRVNDAAINSLCSLKNIKRLRLHECKGINHNLNPWAESLTNLESFEFKTGFFYPTILEEFLIQLVQSCSNTLTKLVINYDRRGRQCVQLFQQIPLYLSSLIHLELPKIYPDELIFIFESCTRLVYLSAILSDEESWEINFNILGRILPNDLQKIQFKEIDNYIFSSEALKHFFEDCDGKLKYLEINGKFNFDQHYFDVANELGIQLIRTDNCI